MQKKLDVSSIEIPVGHVKADPAVGRRCVHSAGWECALYNGANWEIGRMHIQCADWSTVYPGIILRA